MQTRGSSRAGQLQCGLRRRGAGKGARVQVASQAQAPGRLGRAVCQGSRAGSEGKKINLVIAVARAKDCARARGEKDKPLLGFLVNSETRHRGSVCWAFLLTVKRDTGGANNQVSEKLGS